MSQQPPPINTGYPISGEVPEAPEQAQEFVDASENLTLSIAPDTIPDNFVTFHADSEEIMSIGPGGFFVRGKQVADEIQVYKAFVEWLQINQQGMHIPPVTSEIVNELNRDKTKKGEYKRFDMVRWSGMKMSAEKERMVVEYRQAGHKVTRFKQRVDGATKSFVEIQIDIFGKKMPEEIEKGINY